MKGILTAIMLFTAMASVYAENYNSISLQGVLDSSAPVNGVKVRIWSDGQLVGTASDVSLVPDTATFVFSTSTYISDPKIFLTGLDYELRLSSADGTPMSSYPILATPFALTVRGDVQTGNQNVFGAYGNVGIGTSTPTYRLVISSSGATSDIMLAISTGTTNVISMNGVGEIYAKKFFGDGSGLTNLTGDNLGNHVATGSLNMANYGIVNVSTMVFSNLDHSTVLVPNVDNSLNYASNYGIAIGEDTSGNYSGGVGMGMYASDNYSSGVGVGMFASGNYNYGVGIGDGAFENYYYGVGVGVGANHNYSFGVGVGANASSNYNDGIGVGHEASGNKDYATGIGAYSKNNQTYGSALGAYSYAASNATALGSSAKANAQQSVAIGAGTINNSTGTANFGTYAITTSSHMIVTAGGKYYGDGSGLTGITAESIAAGNITAGTLSVDVIVSSVGVNGVRAGSIVASAIKDADINISASINAAKINSGVVSNEEFNYLDDVISPIQVQLNTKAVAADVSADTMTLKGEIDLKAVAATVAADTTTIAGDLAAEIASRANADNDIGVATGTLRTDLTAVSDSTGVLNGRLDIVAADTATLKTQIDGKVSKGGDTMAGQLTLVDASTLTVTGNAFSVGGAQFYVNASSVGINMATPEVALDILAPVGNTADAMYIRKYSNNTAAPIQRFRKARGSGTTIVANGDGLGNILFQGWDGTTWRNAAQITVKVDGEPGESDMPGYIYFGTTPDGSATSIERMRITNAGDIGIGTTVPAYRLVVSSGAGEAGTILAVSTGTSEVVRLTGMGEIYANKYYGDGSELTNVAGIDNTKVAKTGDTMTGQLTLADSTLTVTGSAFSVGGSTLIVSHGTIGVGPQTAIGLLHVSTSATGQPSLFVSSANGRVGIGTVNPGSLMEIVAQDAQAYYRATAYRDNTGAGGVQFYKARGTFDSPTIVQNGDALFAIQGYGHDGIDMATRGAQFEAFVDGSPSSDFIPGAFRFYTGRTAGAIVEKMRITNFGNVGVGTNAPAYRLVVSSGAGETGTIVAVSTGTSEVVRLTGMGEIYANKYYGDGSELTNVAGIDNTKVAKAGDTMTGQLTLAGSSVTVTGNAFSVGGSTLNVENGVVAIGNTADTTFKLKISHTGDVFGLERYAAVGGGANVSFRKSRGATVGINEIVQEGDTLGQLTMTGANGTGYTNGAIINAVVDGAPGAANDLPGAIKFWTTPDGSGTSLERMIIKNNGNVGIGTTAPDQKLTVAGNISTTGQVISNGTGTNYFAGHTGFGVAVPGTPIDASGIIRTDNRIQSTGVNNMLRLTYPAVADFDISVNSSGQLGIIGGNVGIGTTAPDQKLTVAGDISNTGVIISSGAGDSYISGRVGIGIAADSKLRIRQVGSYASAIIDTDGTDYAYWRAANSTTGTTFGNENATGGAVLVGGLAYAGVVNQTGSYPLQFGTNNTARMTILNTGLVGIGTSAPERKLHVLGTGEMFVNIAGEHETLFGDSAYAYFGIYTPASPTRISFRSGTSELLTIKNDGNVGIGTTNPSYKLDVTGDGHFTSSVTANGGITSSTGINAGYYQIDGSTVMAICGTNNICIGVDAGKNNTGYSNSFLGTYAGDHNTTGDYHTFVGYGAGSGNTTGRNNSYVGYGAGLFNKTGSANAILGAYAGYGVINNSFSSSTIMGYGAGGTLTTGEGNIFLGFQAGDNITTGSRNILIGYGIEAPDGGAATNYLNIGNLIVGTIGSSSVTVKGNLYANGTLQQSTVKSCTLGLTTDASGAITGCVASDQKLKTNIVSLIYASVDKIDKLRPVAFNWNEETVIVKDAERHFGFIAEEVREIYPDAVSSAGEGLLGVDSNAMIAILVKEIQALRARVADLESSKQ